MRNYLFLFTLLITISSCEKKANPEDFPVTFDDLTLNITTISKVDSVQGFDSSYTKINVERSKVISESISAFDVNGQKKFDLDKSFNYNDINRLTSVAYNGGEVPQNVSISYSANEQLITYNYQGDIEDTYDDSIVAFSLPTSGSKRPIKATVSYYWINGSKKLVYQMQDEVTFNYNGNSVARVNVNFKGAVDSIFDPTVNENRVNYDTTKTVKLAANSTPTPKLTFAYVSQNRVNKLQSYYPHFFHGFESFLLSDSDYPKQIIKEYYKDGSVEKTEYISFVYLSDVVTGEIKQINEHRSFISAGINSENLKTNYFFNRD